MQFDLEWFGLLLLLSKLEVRKDVFEANKFYNIRFQEKWKTWLKKWALYQTTDAHLWLIYRCTGTLVGKCILMFVKFFLLFIL